MMHTMNKKHILLGILGLGLVSCTTNVLQMQESQQREMTFVASVEADDQTKTVLQEDRMSVWWSPKDTIKVFAAGISGMFISTNTEPVSQASFTGTLTMVTGSLDNEDPSGSFWAVYPYKYAGQLNDDTSVEVRLPSEQVGADNTFAKEMFPAVAQSSNLNLSFYNVCGGIVFTVSEEGIRTVTLRGNNDEQIAGLASFSFESGIPVVKTLGTETSILLKAPGDGTFTPGVRYFISVLPQSFEGGFTLDFAKADSKSAMVFTAPATIRRSRFLVVENADVEATEYEYTFPEEVYQDLEALYDSFAMQVPSQNGASIYVPLRAVFNMCGDDVFGAGANFGDNDQIYSLNEFRHDADNPAVEIMYKKFYTFIASANAFIDKYQDDLPKALGPAKVLRAYSYLMLAIGWGTPPLIDHVLEASELPYNCDSDPGRSMTRKQLYEWCARECEEAAAVLYERQSTQDQQGAYQVTKGFAQALAGKAYLFAEEYAKAKDLLSRVISSGKYALVPGDRYWENFHIEGDGNEEKLFEPNLEYDPSVGTWGGPIQKSSWMESNLFNWRSDHFVSGRSPHRIYTGGADGWGGLGVPQWFGDEFFDNDGHSPRFDATLKHIDDAVYNMEYSDASINAMSLEQKKASPAVGIADSQTGLYGQSFWLPFKQLIRGTDAGGYGSNVRLNNPTIMRYAEVLLLYAEACLQTGDNAQALQAVNQIQVRAGSKTVSTTVDMDVLKREKSYELWFEGSRWADLVRWGDTGRVKLAGQAVPCLFDKLYRAPRAEDEGLVWEHGSEADSRFYTVVTHEAIDRGMQVGFVEGKHNLFPYPPSELGLNPNLVQNPGW